MVPTIDRLNNRLAFLKPFDSHQIGLSACRILMRLWWLSYIGLLAVIFTFLCTSPSAGEAARGVKPAEETVSSVDLGTYHALIIGINAYSEWPPLKFAEPDASDIRKILINRYGFAPEGVTDLFGARATRKNILSELRDKLESLGENDNLLVYYAGHGQLDPLTDNGFWIPVEGGLYDEAGWIAFSNINALLTGRKVKARSIVVLTDSCYGGTMLTRGAPPPDYMWETDENIKQYLIRKAKKRCRRVIASGAYEHVPDHSLFADLLKRSLEENTYPMIDLEYLFYTKVYPRLRVIGQKPVSGRLTWSSEEDGQFVLLQKEKVAGPGSPPPPESKVVLTVRSNLYDDTVYIDGQAKGSTPQNLVLEPGLYTVRVEKEGYYPYEKQLDLAPGKNNTVWAQLNPIAPETVIDYFEADPLHINRGQTATLRWRTQHAEDVEISGIGGVPSSGSKLVAPRQTTSYVLIAMNKEGRQTEREIRITVEIEDPKIVSFRASPTSIRRGESSTLRWKTENAQSVHITGIGRVGLSDSMPINLSETVSYTLIAENEEGVKVKKELTIVVKAPPPRILSFQADRSTITRGESSSLHWQVSDAVEVSINGRTVRNSDSRAVNPRENSKYVLTAKNEEGATVTKDLMIRVVVPAPKIVRFKAKSPISKGSFTTLTWETRNSEKVEISGLGRFGPTGETKARPNATTTYTLTVKNENGSDDKDATVKVNPKPAPPSPPRSPSAPSNFKIID